ATVRTTVRVFQHLQSSAVERARYDCGRCVIRRNTKRQGWADLADRTQALMVKFRLLFAACAVVQVAAAQPKFNIILVSLDQCQADQLHAWGNPRETSPNLDRMAREG